MRNPPEEPPCAECWPECLPENVEAINIFLYLFRQIKFDPRGRPMDADIKAVIEYITVLYEKSKWEELIANVINLIRKVGIPKYIEEVKE
jgi:hypothetical protein